MNRNYVCEKCGGNHPTEAHQNAETERLFDPNYLPSHQELLEAKQDDKYFVGKYRFERHMGFEVLNRELIASLANYLVDRISNKIGKRPGQPTIILEVGAGNGRLTHFLQEALNQLAPNEITMIATDPQKGSNQYTPIFPVEKIDHKNALQKYQPTVVISAWMPQYEDFTEDFRNTPSVQEYILLGDRGACGEAWETWGDSNYLEMSFNLEHEDEEAEFVVPVPLYEKDGFEAVYLKEVDKNQIKDHLSPHTETTVAFRKKAK